MPWILPFIAALSLITFGVYYLDKRAALRGARRTPETTLHVLSILGGWPGALLAQRIIRHKSGKAGFQLMFWMTVIVNVPVFAWLWTH